MFVLVATEILFSSFDLYTDEDVEAQRQFCGQALRLKRIRRKVCPFNRRRRLCYTSSGLVSDHSPDRRRRHRRRTTRVRSRILPRSPHRRVATGRSSSPLNRDSRQRPSSGVTFVLLPGMKRPHRRNDSSSRRRGGIRRRARRIPRKGRRRQWGNLSDMAREQFYWGDPGGVLR